MMKERIAKLMTQSNDMMYQALFGKSRAELLEAARNLPYVMRPLMLWGDEDENMRDAFSSEALDAVTYITNILTVTLSKLPIQQLRQCSDEQLLGLVAYAVNESASHYLAQHGYKKGEFIPVWYEMKKQ